MSLSIPAPAIDLGLIAQTQGLLGWVKHMDAQGDIRIRKMLHGTLTVPSPARAFGFFRKACDIGLMIPFVNLALANKAQIPRLNLRLDPIPARIIIPWQAVEVTGVINLAGLLGLPAVDPVAEVEHLLTVVKSWKAYWGTPVSMKECQGVPHLNIYKRSERVGFEWVLEDGREGLIELNQGFQAKVKADPLVSGWLDTLQRGLAAKRMGPHSWSYVTYADTVGRDSLLFPTPIPVVAPPSAPVGPPSARGPK